jgi:hypothetical protein
MKVSILLTDNNIAISRQMIVAYEQNILGTIYSNDVYDPFSGYEYTDQPYITILLID